MRAINLKTNHLTAPVGIDAGPLFLSWQCADGVRQTAYEIELTANGETVWHSGKVQSAAMHADAPTVGGSRVRGCWRVRLWDENGVPGAWSLARFETGLAQCDWAGEWVDPETEPIDIPGDDAINAFARPNWERKQVEKEAAGKGTAEPYKPHRPASYLRKVFTAPKSEARLYITAKGLYVAWLNGVRVGEMVLAPGSFTGNKHLGAQTYDVTALLHEGENELLIALGDGWHRSTGGVDGDRDLFGDTLGVLFQLEVDGKPVCVSDDTMQATQCGPIRQNDMQQGEVYDARLEGELTGWHGVRAYRDDLPILGMNTVPILEHETFPGKLLQTPNGETVLDFGQNLAGYVEMALTAHTGQKVKLTCGETLDENGNFTQENFQDRNRHKEGGTAQMLELVCKEGENHCKPSFTIMGFRYAKVETDADLTDAVFTAHAVYSDMAVTGTFTCGNDAVNRALLLALQLCRAERAQCAENFIAQHCQQPECNVVVAVLLKKAQNTAQNAAADGKGNDCAIGQGDALTQGFGNADRTAQRYAHGAQKANGAVYDCQKHNVGKAAQKQNKVRHNCGAASAKLGILFHFSTSA